MKTVSKSRPRNCEYRDYSATGGPTSPNQSKALCCTDYASTPETSGRAGSRKWTHLSTMIITANLPPPFALAAHGSIPGCHGRRVGSRLCIMPSMGYTTVYNAIDGLYDCDECLWENGGGWLGRNTLRASYLTRWRLLGSMVWETGCLMVKDHISSGWEDYTGMS